MSDLADTMTLDGTVVVVGEAGLLIQGPSGSGKSSLALAILADVRPEGRFARLVADDRTRITRHGDLLVACPHPVTAGLIERRGLGIIDMAHEPACVLRLAVQIVDDVAELPDRLPERPPARCLLGVNLPVLPLLARDGARENSARVRWTLDAERMLRTERF